MDSCDGENYDDDIYEHLYEIYTYQMRKFSQFQLQESKDFMSNYIDDRCQAIFVVAEKYAHEVQVFMQSKGQELLEYKAYLLDDSEYYGGQIHMLFSGSASQYKNRLIVFRYLNDGGFSEPLFWTLCTKDATITKDDLDKISKKACMFNNIDKFYLDRKGYSWDEELTEE